MEWLLELERQVASARRKIAALRKENRELRESSSGRDVASVGAARRQREDARRRVARLADRLDKLV